MKAKLLLPILAIAAILNSADANATYCANGAKDYPTCTPPKATKPPPVKPPVKTPPPAAQPAPVAPPAAAPAPTPTVVVVPAPAAAPAPAAPVSLASELTPSQVATLRQQAAAEAAAAGGAGGAGGAAQVTDQSQYNSNSKAWGLSLSLPQPIQLAAMAGVGCPTPNVSQSSTYWLWGAHASGASGTNTDACVLMAGYSHYLSMCQFRSASVLLGRIMELRAPGYKAPPAGGLVDMTPEQCEEFRRPKVPTDAAAVPPAPPATNVQKVSLSADALFDFDKAVLKPAGRAKLDELAAKLQGEAANIVVTGHTDSRGTDAYNQSLSMRRANAVRAHLALAGIDLARMIAIGKGKTEPVCTERTEACMERNRRVDVQITVQPVSRKLATLVSGPGVE